MPAPSSFDYAIVRVVPRVERDELINAGAIVFASTLDYLGAQIALDSARLTALAPGIDVAEVERALALIPLIAAGGAAAGAIGALSKTERFHWLVAPRSTIVQTSPVHSGICTDPALLLAHLIKTVVLLP